MRTHMTDFFKALDVDWWRPYARSDDDNRNFAALKRAADGSSNEFFVRNAKDTSNFTLCFLDRKNGNKQTCLEFYGVYPASYWRHELYPLEPEDGWVLITQPNEIRTNFRTFSELLASVGIDPPRMHITSGAEFDLVAWGGMDDGFHDGGAAAEAEVRAIVFIDFDKTFIKGDVGELLGETPTGLQQYITNNDIYHLLQNYKDLSNPTIRRVFNAMFPEPHQRNVREFWRQLHALGSGVEVQMISHDYEAVIELAFILLKLEPLPTKITGRTRLQHLHNEKHKQKARFIRKEVNKRQPEFVVFADDHVHERVTVGNALQTIADERGGAFDFLVCCDDLTDGLSKQNMDDIVRWLREKLE